MTRAEKMREITNRANEQYRITREAKHFLYTKNTIMNRVIDRLACKGRSKAIVKIPKRFSPCLIIDTLREHGFEVREARLNGRSVLTIEW